VGNYILAECLYRSNIDPFATLSELSELLQRRLFQEIRSVAQESYQAQGLTRTNGGTFRNVQGGRGQFEFQLQCYGRDVCVKGNPVIKLTEGPHKRTIWYTAEQLFRPLADRVNLNPEAAKPEMNVLEGDSGGQHFDTPGNVENMISGLTDVGWKKALAGAIHSSYFSSLAAFIEQERESGTIIYPRQEDVFSALNLCPLEKVKVVIVGQDPYHGPGQGHGLAFSVRRGVKPPPSLKNIVREAMNDVGIEEPTHGNLEHWAQQGVLLLNTVLSVQQGQANSHSKKGWEEFTDAVIDELNTNCEGLVFLLWGSPAAKKAKNVDESKHTVIRTSHPSPLGATKTSSPFLGSRCFSRANAALEKRNKTPIDWNVV
jgi:uracil-DNA glycosylase